MNGKWRSVGLTVLALGQLALLSACESSRPAPVVDRGSAVSVAPAARRATNPTAPQPKVTGAARANATAPAAPGVQINAIDENESIELRPIDARPIAAASPAAGAVRTEPRGYKLPWSEENVARVRGTTARPDAKLPEPRTTTDRAGADRPAGLASLPATPPASAERLAEAAADRPDFAWPVKGRLIERFEGNSRGIGIAAAEGEPVQAAASGTVLYAGSGIRGYGQLLIVKHNESYISVYAHNSRLLVKQGETVRAGQKIAEVGHTDASRSKLHFEIRRQGTSIDPLTLLPARD